MSASLLVAPSVVVLCAKWLVYLLAMSSVSCHRVSVGLWLFVRLLCRVVKLRRMRVREFRRRPVTRALSLFHLLLLLLRR